MYEILLEESVYPSNDFEIIKNFVVKNKNIDYKNINKKESEVIW